MPPTPVEPDMTTRTPARHTERLILVATALLLPTLSLVPLGGLYLWDNELVLWWALGALALAATASFLQRRLLGSAAPPATAGGEAGAERRRDRLSSDAEEAAWRDVRTLARNLDVDALDSPEAVLGLGRRTIDAVARRMHPGKSDAVWRFTAPEALAITERVSRKLGVMIETRVPFGDQLTIAQVLTAYRWRGIADVAERAYDVWRLLRLVNPATAATQEARERLSRAMFNWSREHVSRRIAEAFVEEVGQAAIDLYGGRLRTAAARARSADTAADGPVADEIDADESDAGGRGPVDALLVGAAPDRTLIAASLAGLDEAKSSPAEGAAAEALVRWRSSDAVWRSGFGRRQLTRAAREADVVVWVIDAVAGPSQGDLAALAHLRGLFAAEPGVISPQLLIVASRSGSAVAKDLDQAAAALTPGASDPQISHVMPVAEIVPFDAQGEARRADALRLRDLVARGSAHARRIRARRSLEQSQGRGGLVSAGAQAARNVGGLTGWLFSRRPQRDGE